MDEPRRISLLVFGRSNTQYACVCPYYALACYGVDVMILRWKEHSGTLVHASAPLRNALNTASSAATLFHASVLT